MRLCRQRREQLSQFGPGTPQSEDLSIFFVCFFGGVGIFALIMLIILLIIPQVFPVCPPLTCSDRTRAFDA